METSFDWAFRDSPALVLMVDAELVCRGLSGAWRDRTDLKVDEEASIPLDALLALDKSPALRGQLERLFDQEKQISNLSAELRLSEGTVAVTLSAWRVLDLSTQESNLVLLATGADCSTEDADEVAQLRSHHQLILNSAGEGVWGLDKDGKITFGNKAAVEILGWKLDQVIGQSSHEVHHHSHADGAPYPRSECPIFASLRDGEVHKVDNEVFWHTNGDPIPVEYTSTPILKDGKPNGAVIVFRDNSARREIEAQHRKAFEELERLRTEYQLILNAAGEGIYGLNRDGLITFSNAASTEILGWKSNNIQGLSSHEIHHHSHADGRNYPRDECPIYASIKNGEVCRMENEVFWHVDGTAVPVEYTSTPIMQEGEPIGAVVVFRDISDRKAIEKQRELAYEEIKDLKEKLEMERDYLRDEVNTAGSFGGIIGESAAIKRTLAQVEAVASTPASVLILGESGVGKEMIARAIHSRSDRAECPMIKVNCASIPAELFESEFFGHVKGSFTGAHKDRVGRLQLADGGTLFLDEVGEIPLAQQGKLLRALQENEFERVGDDKTMRVDVRVVAATNRDLELEVKEGRFREDLFYRISVFPIKVPALRERIPDIAPIALFFLENTSRELGRANLNLSRSQIAALERHPWPGNIRELKNTIDRSVISSNNRLRLELTDSALIQLADENPVTSSTTDSEPSYLTSVEFRELEKANIIAALKSSNWKTWGDEGAAALLGVKPSTLAYQMKTFGIQKMKK